ncbi:MAG: hypothetical protein IPM16_17215 [Chloroflexi bacterium]|nr:hypothetical protein [Chloroflexota bacterium]
MIIRALIVLLVVMTPTRAQDDPLVVVPQVRYGLGQAYTAVWSPDGERLVVGGSAGIAVYDAKDWSEPPEVASMGYGVTALAFSPAGTWLAVGRADGTALATRLDGTPSQLYTIGGPVPERGAMRNFNVSARYVAFVPSDTSFDTVPQPRPVLSTQTVTDRDGAELRLLVAVFTEDMPDVSPVQPGGTFEFSIEPLKVTIRDSETGDTVAELVGFTQPVRAVELAEEAYYLDAASADGTIIRYVAATGEIESLRAGDYQVPPFNAPVTATGARGLKAESMSTTGLVLTRPDGSTTELIAEPADVRSLAFDSTGSRLAVGQRTGTLWVFDVASGDMIFSGYRHFGHIVDILWIMDDSLIVTAGEDTVIMITDPDDGAERARFQAHNDVVTSLAIHPQASNIFVSGSLDGTAAMWLVEPPE